MWCDQRIWSGLMSFTSENLWMSLLFVKIQRIDCLLVIKCNMWLNKLIIRADAIHIRQSLNVPLICEDTENWWRMVIMIYDWTNWSDWCHSHYLNLWSNGHCTWYSLQKEKKIHSYGSKSHDYKIMKKEKGIISSTTTNQYSWHPLCKCTCMIWCVYRESNVEDICGYVI